MKLEEAIIIIEDTATLMKIAKECYKTEEERIRRDECFETYKYILKELKILVNVDFEEIDREVKAEGDRWYKLDKEDV